MKIKARSDKHIKEFIALFFLLQRNYTRQVERKTCIHASNVNSQDNGFPVPKRHCQVQGAGHPHLRILHVVSAHSFKIYDVESAAHTAFSVSLPSMAVPQGQNPDSTIAAGAQESLQSGMCGLAKMELTRRLEFYMYMIDSFGCIGWRYAGDAWCWILFTQPHDPACVGRRCMVGFSFLGWRGSRGLLPAFLQAFETCA